MRNAARPPGSPLCDSPLAPPLVNAPCSKRRQVLSGKTVAPGAIGEKSNETLPRDAAASRGTGTAGSGSGARDASATARLEAGGGTGAGAAGRLAAAKMPDAGRASA